MADSKFVIDGKEYDIPGLDTFDIDEAMLLYANTGFGLEDLVYDEDAEDASEVAGRFRHPGLTKTLLHVAYQRGNPQMNKKRVADLIGKSNYADAFVQLISSAADEGDAMDPTKDSTNGPPLSSPASSSSKPESTSTEPSSSGNGSSTNTETSEETSGVGEDPLTSSMPGSPTGRPVGIRERTQAA